MKLSTVFIWQDSSEFDIHAEKLYKWVASSVTEKNAFIHSIWKVSTLKLN